MGLMFCKALTQIFHFFFSLHIFDVFKKKIQIIFFALINMFNSHSIIYLDSIETKISSRKWNVEKKIDLQERIKCGKMNSRFFFAALKPKLRALYMYMRSFFFLFIIFSNHASHFILFNASIESMMSKYGIVFIERITSSG